MSLTLSWKLGTFGAIESRAKLARGIEGMIEALTTLNMLYLSEHPDTPPLYQSGVRWAPEEREEVWKDAPEVLRDGAADCEDLTAFRLAELRLSGAEASPLVEWEEAGDGAINFHALIVHADGSREDPSERLGM